MIATRMDSGADMVPARVGFAIGAGNTPSYTLVCVSFWTVAVNSELINRECLGFAGGDADTMAREKRR